MNLFLSRRQFLCGATSVIAAPFLLNTDSWAAAKLDANNAKLQLAALEKEFGGHIGLFALDTADGATLGHRANERFPFCSTFKAMLAAAVLARSTPDAKLLEKRLHFSKKDLAGYSPITEQHLKEGMTVAELCAATMQYSDNTAANLLLKEVGGPAGLTKFARSLGDQEFRLDRTEPALNSAMPGDARDTTTPQAMAQSLRALALGEGLQAAQRQQFQTWLKGNTTGDERIRAGVPKEWQVGDKTGTGSYGSANDIAVLWHDKRAPVVLAIYTVQKEKDAKSRSDVVAAAARIVVGWLG